MASLKDRFDRVAVSDVTASRTVRLSVILATAAVVAMVGCYVVFLLGRLPSL
jgi:hypothetical protein